MCSLVVYINQLIADFINIELFMVFPYCCCSVAQSCPTPYDPMDCSTPGFLVLHYLLGLAQTHAHWIDDDIQQSHSLLPSFPPILNLSQHQGLFQWLDSLHRWPKYWSFSFSISPSNEYSIKTDWFDLSKGLSRVFSNTTVQKHQFFGPQLPLFSKSHTHTWLLEKPQPWLDGLLSAK